MDNPSYVLTSIIAARKLLLLDIRNKVHSGYEINVWQDPWIPSTPARPARSRVPVVNPKMTLSSLINSELKEWDARLLEQYVDQEDIPMIESLATSHTNRSDNFCWNYTKSGQYTVKSGYWVATNILTDDEEQEMLQPSITKLQAFDWKVNAPQKICHLIWQLISWQVAATMILVRRNMRCGNYCPRCGEPEETVTHAIFECSPALQAWALSSTPSNSQTFPISSIYANMDYLFWRKNSIMELEKDRDPYPWIIWYIWKARNDKLFRGIDRDPLELIRYAESECQAWYNAKDTIYVPPQAQIVEETQALSLGNICMVDGSWTSTAHFSGIGCVWKDNMGKIQLMGTRNLKRRETSLHSELEALKWAMESMLQHSTCQRFGTDSKD